MRLQRLDTGPADKVLRDCVYQMEDVPTGSVPPEQYRFNSYELPMAFNKTEAEEVAARLIILCYRYGQGWVGLDYNAFRRMVAEELETGNMPAFTMIRIELLRYGATIEDAITNVIAVGINYLRDHGFVTVERGDDNGQPFDVIFPTAMFFERMERFITQPA
jgi:hypothetical protein